MALQTINLSGRGDMGSLTDRMVPPRLFLPVPVYSLSALRVTFAGVTASGSATLYLKVDHRMGPSFDRTIYSFPLVGKDGSNIEFRIDADERDTFLFLYDSQLLARDELVLVWTDPTGGSQATTWAVSADLREGG